MKVSAFLNNLAAPKQLDRIENNQEKIMAAVDDLKAAVVRLTASTSAELKAIADKLSAPTTNPDGPDIQDIKNIAAAVTQLNAIADNLDAQTASLTGASPAV